jgi:hypothetical protein
MKGPIALQTIAELTRQLTILVLDVTTIPVLDIDV